MERRVEPAVLLRDQRRQRLDVGRAELRVDPPLEELVDHRVGRPELLEDRRVGREAGLRLAALRQVQLEEQDLLELLGAAQVELVADVDVDLPLEPLDLAPELLVERGEGLAVEGDPDRLHPGQDRDQRQLDLAEQPVELRVGEAALERLPDGERRQRLETGPGGGRQLRRRRQDLVEVLGDDVGDRLAAQRRVQDVRGDLGVERDRRHLGVVVLAEPGDEDRLDLVADERQAERLDEVAQRGRGLGAIRGHDAAVRGGDRERERRPAPGSRVVGDERRTDEGLGGEPRAEVLDPVGAADLDPARVDDRRRERRGQVADRLDRGRLTVAIASGRGAAVASRRAWRVHRVEIEAELELAALGPRAGPGGAPAIRPADDPGRRHVAAVDHRLEAVRPLLGRLAGHRREALDQRPELVLAEQPDDRVAVVVAEPGRLEVDLDRQVADDSRQVATHEDLVDVLAELVTQLRGRDLVEPGEQRIQRAEVADQLRRGLLADAGHARDVVGRVALERLVVDHLVGPQPEPLVDLRDVVHHRVLDAGARRHQPDPRRDELEHVEVDGDDRRLEVVARVELLRDRPDDVVGLVALHLVDRDPERLDDLADLRELVAEVVRHLRPGRLVLRVLLVAERRARAGRTRPRGSRAGGPGGRAGRCSRSRMRR